MKQIFIFIVTLLTTSSNAMQPDMANTTSLKSHQYFKILPNTSLNILSTEGKITIIAYEEKKPEPKRTSQLATAITSLAEANERTKRLSTLVFGKQEAPEKPCIVTISADMEIVSQADFPCEITHNEKGMHIRTRDDLDRLKIILKELTVKIPNCIPLTVVSLGSIVFETPGASIEARAEDIEYQISPEEKSKIIHQLYQGIVRSTKEIEVEKYPDVTLKSQGTICLRPTQKE